MSGYIYKGELYSIEQLSKISGNSEETIQSRIDYGWKIESAVGFICDFDEKKYVINNKTLSLNDISNITEISIETLEYMVYSNSNIVEIIRASEEKIKAHKCKHKEDISVDSDSEIYERKIYKYNGNMYSIRDISQIFNLPKYKIYQRILKGWSISDIIFYGIGINYDIDDSEVEKYSTEQIQEMSCISYNRLSYKIRSKVEINRSYLNPVYEYNGVKYTLKRLSDVTGTAIEVLNRRLEDGLSVRRAVGILDMKKLKKIVYNGVEYDLDSFELEYKINRYALQKKLEAGYSIKKIAKEISRNAAERNEFEYKGKYYSIDKLSDILCIDVKKIYNGLLMDWSIEKIIDRAYNYNELKYKYKRKAYSIHEISELIGVEKSLIYVGVKGGMSIEEIILRDINKEKMVAYRLKK